MTAIDTLMTEHRVIEQMLTALEQQTGRLNGDGDRMARSLIDFVDLLEQYVDRLHHAKEERRLFEIVIERGLETEGASIMALIHHHDTGRSHLQDLARELRRLTQGDPHAGAACAMVARRYAELLRDHIRTEDEEVFPLVARAISVEEDLSLARYFAEIDSAQNAANLRERFGQLLLRWADLDGPPEITEH
jgi:hemerythrin-like domain-containing protein